ncbi:MAG: ABC transporter ATP-binding protein [Anaeroplasmataceae bacterium]|nr:ABC transporter ATP-binding protein [Anaeroplasmataceae bacterium]
MAFIEVKNLKKIYGIKDTCIYALDDVSFSLERKELVVILGASGAGKSTLLNLLGGMDYASSGNYYVNGIDVTKMKDKELALFRRDHVGFVFQFYNLMPNLTALENVKLSITHSKDYLDPKEALALVGLEERLNNFPSNLSGGEQQRVSIARAIVKKPDILLCDEPTGALDSKTGKSILKLLKSISDSGNQSVIIVTHNANIALVANRVIHLSDGKIVKNEVNQKPLDIEEIKW